MAFIAPDDEVEQDTELFIAPEESVSETYVNTGEGPGTSAFNQAVRSLSKVGTGTVEGIGQLADLGVRAVTPESWESAMTAPFRGLSRGAESVQEAIEQELPVNPAYAESVPTKAAGVAGQVVGQLGTLLTGSAITKVPKYLQALGLGQAGVLGLESGYEEADRLGVSDAWNRDAMALTYAAAEAGVEGMTGFGSKPFIKALIGETQEVLGKGAAKRFAKTVAGEAVEEPITGTAQAGASNIFAEEDPNRPGFALNGQPLPSINPTAAEFWENRGEEALLGGLGGGIFGAAAFIGSRPSRQQKENALRKVDLTLAHLENKPDKTEEDLSDIQELQTSQQELRQDLESEASADQSSAIATEALVNAANAAREAGMPETAAMVESVIPPEGTAQPFIAPEEEVVSEQPTIERPVEDAIQEQSTTGMGAYPSGDQSLGGQESGEGMGQLNQGQETTQQGEAQEVTNALLPTPAVPELSQVPQTPPVETTVPETVTGTTEAGTSVPAEQAPDQATQLAWEDSPEFTQAEELAAQGDVEAAEALEAEFRARQQQAPRALPSSTRGRTTVVADEQDKSIIRSRRRSTSQRILPVKATRADAQVAIEALSNTLPSVRNAWIGTQAELLADDNIRRQFIANERRSDPSLTEEEASDLYDQMMGNSLSEGFTMNGRSYIILDGVGVTEADQSGAGAIRRVLIHEDAHEAIEAAVSADQALQQEWNDLRDRIAPEDLDDLARRRYPTLKDWRNNSQKFNDLAHEFFAEQMETLERGGQVSDPGLIQRFIEFVRKVLARINGQQEESVTDRQILDFIRAGREARAREVRQSGAYQARQSRQNEELLGDLAIPSVPEGSYDLITYEAPYPGVTKEVIAEHAWPLFRGAWISNNVEEGQALSAEQEAALLEDWRAELADENAMEIAADNAFTEERRAKMSMDVYDSGPFSTPAEDSGRILRMSMQPVSQEQDAAYMRAVESGDMETAQGMVDEAAKKAGYGTGPVFHAGNFSIEAGDTVLSDWTHFGTRDAAQERVGGSGVTDNLIRSIEVTQDPATGEWFFSVDGVENEDSFESEEDAQEAAEREAVSMAEYAEAPDATYTRTFLKGDFVEIPDLMTWKLKDVVRELVKKVDFTAAEKTKINNAYKTGDEKLTFNALTDVLVDRGLSSIRYKNAVEDKGSDSYIVLRSSGAKSAEPVTRDEQGNVIPLSQRFNQRISDIRFSMQPSYSSQSEERESDYKEAEAAMPESGRDYVQFLGSLTRTPKVAQAVRPMVDFARSLMGSYQGDEIEVNAENTERVKDLAAVAFQKGKPGSQFAEDISEQFRQSGFSNNGQHQGSVMAGVLQMEILDYAVRLAATGDKSLALALMPYANDVAMGDHFTASNAGRALQARSMAGRQPGFWTALNGLAKGEREMAEKNPIYKELRAALFSDEVKSETLAGIQKDMESTDGQKALTPTEPSAEQEWGRALEVMGQAERDLAIKFFNEMSELELLLEKQAQMQTPKGVKASMQAARELNDPVAIQQRIDELRGSISKTLKALDQFKTSSTSQEARKKALANKPRAKKLISADAQAQKMLDRLANKPKRTKKDAPPWKKTFEEQVKNPKSESDFATELASAGLSPEMATKLYEEAKKLTREAQDRKDEVERRASDRKATQQAASEAKERVREQKREMDRPRRIADQKSFINSLVKQIFSGTLEEQSNPSWRRQVMVNAFLNEGFSQGSAENAADYMGSKLDKHLAAAQEKAAQKAAKDLNMKKPTLEKLVKAIRSRGIDPLNADPATKTLAEEAGFAGITPEQFTELAKLDGQLNGPYQTLRAKAAARMLDIVLAAKPPKTRSQILTQAWVSSALSSLSTMSLSGIHAAFIPARRVLFDLAAIAGDVAIGKTKPEDAAFLIGNTFDNLITAANNMLATVKFAGMNDAYTQHIVQFVNEMHSMKADFNAASKVFTDKNATPGARTKAALKMAFTSTDAVRRVLSTADETWGSMLQDFILRNEAMRQLVQKGKLSPTAAAMLFTSASNIGRQAYEEHLNSTGNATEAQLVQRDATQEALIEAVRVTAGDDAATDVRETATLDSPMELGNRRSEEAPVGDIANMALEWVKTLGISTRLKSELLGRMITGFVTVPANVLNRSVAFTPFGVLRALYKMGKFNNMPSFLKFLQSNSEKVKTAYNETMRTEGQQRMRLIEGITGTVMMLVLAALMPDDGKDGLVITGMGPEEQGLKEAWTKQGHSANRIEWVDRKGNVRFSIPYARGGFDHMNLLFAMLGTKDDMRLKGVKPKGKNVEYGTQFAHTALKGVLNQAKFFGLKNLAGVPQAQLNNRGLASYGAYIAAPFVPWSGFTKSLGRMWTGPTDQSSVESAIIAQMPFTNFFASDSLNALGDQRGPSPTDEAWDRAVLSGVPWMVGAYNKGPDEDLYEMMISRGIAPSVPYRTILERQNGFLEDSQWEAYLKLRGSLIKRGMRKNLRRLKLLEHKDAQNLMERLGSDATKEAKKKLGLK